VLALAASLFVLFVDAERTAGGAGAADPHGTIVFASDRSGTFELYSARPDGSQLGQLTRNRAADTAPLFSPNGRRIAFVRSPRQFASELWVMKADGSGQRKLAARGTNLAWSPDSRRIAYVSGSRAASSWSSAATVAG
jgi:TolB protein